MILNLKRFISLLLVLMLLIGIVPTVHADGIDTSWIWDADYEGLNKDQIKKVIVGGKRWHDMGFRLEVSGFDPGLMTTATNNETLLDEISKLLELELKFCKKIK